MSTRSLALKGETLHALDCRAEVLSMEVEDERLADRDDQAVVCAAEDVLKFVGGVGGRLRVLLEPVADLCIASPQTPSESAPHSRR